MHDFHQKSRKFEDEVKAEEKRVCSTLTLTSTSTSAFLRCYAPQSGTLEQMLFLVGWLWKRVVSGG
jgi:hypothetical protein